MVLFYGLLWFFMVLRRNWMIVALLTFLGWCAWYGYDSIKPECPDKKCTME